MAIKIKSASGTGITGGVGILSPVAQEVMIEADTEADLTSLPAYGQPVTDVDKVSVIPAKSSIAYTVDGAIGYKLSPSGVWTKFKG